MKEVSILILTHNAPAYVRETLETLNEITNPLDREKMEICVWDNASDEATRIVLDEMKMKGYIDKLEICKENLLFAGGNNACSRLASKESKYYLLLNSDVSIRRSDWYANLLAKKTKGNYVIASYGVCRNPNRADGYCYLIDRDKYDSCPLNENYQWFWGITLQQAYFLKNKFNILAIDYHNTYIVHYGGKSGFDFRGAKGMSTNIKEVFSWFSQGTIGGKVIVEYSSKFQLIIYNFKKIRRLIYKLVNL